MGCLGIEPRTFRLKTENSTVELTTLIFYNIILVYLLLIYKYNTSKILLSSRGLGYLPFTEITGIRIPLGVIFIK